MNKTESKREREKRTVAFMIREVMRFSGPRMPLYHPVMAVCHVIESKKEAKRLEKTDEH